MARGSRASRRAAAPERGGEPRHAAGPARGGKPRRAAPPPGPAARRQRVWTALAIASLLLAGGLAYAPSLHHPFVNWDDPAYVTANPYIASLSPAAVARLFLPTTIVVANWAPVTLLSYAIDHALGGLDPAVYHCTNVLLHLASGVMVFLLLGRLLPRAAGGTAPAAAWAGALLFLLHPIQVESVAWVAERKNVLSLALALAAMLIELGAARPPAATAGGRASPTRHRRHHRRRLLALALFAAALLAKATVVVVPLLLIAVWRLLDGLSWRDAGRRALPYFGLGLAGGAVTLLAQGSAGAIKAYHGGSPLLTIATRLRVTWLELALLVDPRRLAAVYRPAIAASPFEPSVLLAAAGVAAIAAVAVACRRRQPLVTLCILWYAIGLLPVLNLVPIPHLMADRFLYLSSIGAAGLTALGLRAAGSLLAARSARAGAATLCIVAGGALAGGTCLAATRARLPVWSSSERLWRDTIARTPEAEVAYSNLGLLLAARGENDAAIASYRRALALRPDYVEAAINLANALTRAGRLEEALAVYERAAARAPGNAEVHYNHGVALMAAGRPAEARAAYEDALRADPRHARALVNLADLALRAGDAGHALELVERALDVEPRNAEAHLNRGLLLGRLGRAAEALAELRRAIELRPDYARAHLQLGLALLARGERPAGRAALDRALALDPRLGRSLPAAVRRAAGLGDQP